MLEALRAEPMLRAQIVALDMELAAFEAMVERYRDEAEAGAPIGAAASMLKYFATDLNMKRQELMMSVLGMAGLDRDAATADISTEWLGWIANKIGGGSSEVQLNVVAKRCWSCPAHEPIRRTCPSDDDIRMLRDSAARFFAEAEGATALRRRAMPGTSTRWRAGAWDGMAALGLTGALVPEAFGGRRAGLSRKRAGRGDDGPLARTGPFVSTAVDGGDRASCHGDNDRLKTDILPAIATGDAVLAIAGEERSRHTPLASETRARREGGGYRISGRKIAVIDANIADKFIVAARDAEAPDKLLLLLVEGRTPAGSGDEAMGVDSQPLSRDVEFRDAVADAGDLPAHRTGRPPARTQL